MRDIKITITGKELCPNCNGDGVVWPSIAAEKRGDSSKMVTCHNCHGEGIVENSQEVTLAEFRDMMNAMEDED